jgi:GNAT superfamily N-acetyltransferase
MPAEITPPRLSVETVRLFAADALAIVAPHRPSFPGFFRNRTCETGSSYGVRCNSERVMLDGYSENRAVCTHPAHRGKGFGAAIIWQLARYYRRNGLVSCPQVGAANTAFGLYRRMGFEVIRAVTLKRIRRAGLSCRASDCPRADLGDAIRHPRRATAQILNGLLAALGTLIAKPKTALMLLVAARGQPCPAGSGKNWGRSVWPLIQR